MPRRLRHATNSSMITIERRQGSIRLPVPKTAVNHHRAAAAVSVCDCAAGDCFVRCTHVGL